VGPFKQADLAGREQPIRALQHRFNLRRTPHIHSLRVLRMVGMEKLDRLLPELMGRIIWHNHRLQGTSWRRLARRTVPIGHPPAQSVRCRIVHSRRKRIANKR
jgi:hypothetical protein